MANTVGVNTLSVVTKDSGGTVMAFPDVCLTPGPGGTVPIPYVNVARSADMDKGTDSVTVNGSPVCVHDSNLSTSTGNEAGSSGGVVSGKTKGKAEFVNFSFDVQMEGRHVVRALDLMILNDRNTPPAPLMQPPVVAVGESGEARRCLVCDKPL